MSTIMEPLLDAISQNNLATLRTLLGAQDRQLLAETARIGSPETAAYLLSRHPTTHAEFSQYLATSDPALHPTQYLAREAARNGNAPLFRYLVTQYPSLLSLTIDDRLLSTTGKNHRNVESILVDGMSGGVRIWEIILENNNARWMDYEFVGHHGCVLEIMAWLGHKEVLEMLLKRGADTMREGDPVLELARLRGARKDILELIKKYQPE